MTNELVFSIGVGGVVLVSIGLLVSQHIFHQQAQRAWTTERACLLNRIMARSYTEFKMGEAPDETLTPHMTDEDEARIEGLAQGALRQAEQALMESGKDLE